jgi:Rhs element Vgr protein
MSVVTPTIVSDGQPIDPTYPISAIDICKEVDRIPYAQVVFLDGNAAQQLFPLSNTGLFEPGKTIEIKARYEGQTDQEQTLFEGVVVGQRVEADLSGSFLIVELKDAAVKLTATRKSTVYRQQTDDKIINDILTGRSLQVGTIAATPTTHPELVRYDCTDWDFIRLRAESNGLLTIVNDGEVSCLAPTVADAAKHRFAYGITPLYDFAIEANAEQQYPEIQSIAWDIKNQKLSKAVKAKEFAIAQGNLNGGAIAKSVGVETQTLLSATPLAAKELQAWCDAAMVRSRLSLIRGRVAVPGFGLVKLLDVIEIASVSNRFNGKTLVTGIRQRIDQQGWRTDLQFGLIAQRFAQQPNVMDAPAAGLLPAVHGLQIGVVDQFEEDPEKEFRVKVLLPGIHETEGVVWARLATPEAGNGRGYFFRPEAGDEVVIGFFNADPRQAVVLGSLYSSKNRPPQSVATLTKENKTKAIVTKSGTTIHFVDDAKASLLIQTPNKNQLLLDDDGQKIALTDQHGNTIVLSKDGIVIKSAKELTLEAGGNVTIKGQKVDVK